MKKQMVNVLFFIGLAFAATVHADDCANKFAWGKPTGITVKVTEVCHVQYGVAFDIQNKIPIYSAELLLPNTSTKLVRVNAFKADPLLPINATASNKDYLKAGYDRGHLTPFEDTTATAAGAAESFYFSNIAPQNPQLNRIAWKALEEHVRKWANHTTGGLYVITGVYSGPAQNYIGNHIRVPDYFYKIVLDKTTGDSVAFLAKNTTPENSFFKYSTNVASIEKLTGISFFPGMPPAQATKKTTVAKEFTL